MPGVEDQIFANIESGSGETFDDGIEQDTSSNEPTTKAGPGQEQDHELDNAREQLRSRERPRLEEDRGQLPKDQRAKPDPKREGADQQKKTDEFGNLEGSNSWHVTRRLKSQLDNQRQANQSMKTQLDNLTRQLAETQVLNDLPKQLGLSNTDTAELLQLSAVLKANPTKGARKVIEIALAKGANLKDIVNDEFIPNLTLNAVQRQLDERLGPMQKEREAAQDVSSQDTEAIAQAHQFLADYPEAEIHADILKDQMDKVQKEYDARGVKVAKYIIAEKAFNRIEEFCRNNQLDINQPLGPQVQARQQQKAPAGVRSPTRQTPRPMPNGSGGGDLQPRKQNTANADDSFGSIVRESLLEAGYQL